MCDVAAPLLEHAETHGLVVQEDLAPHGALGATGYDVQEGLLSAA